MEATKLALGLHLFLFQLNLVVFAVDVYSRNDFPPGFVFGAATSAFQYEGAVNEDGRTPSIWDTFTHAGSMHGDNADIACDGYHKYKEDVQLMAHTGLDAYRFSISWSRLIPNGRGPVNLKGLQYYNNFINELIRNGIQPHVTLHHTDLPQALEDEYGGWLNQKIVRDFTAYADVCFKEFGDRVLHWTSVNEANVFVLGGYDLGFLPPQHCSASLPFNCSKGNSSTEPYMAAHNILLAHAAVAKLYKKKYQDKQHGLIGLNLFNYWFVPLTNSTEDIIAAQRANDFYVGWVKSLNAYIGSVLDAIRNGSDTRGYLTWSFLDVFEMLDGYESSYGLYYVDLDDPDLARYPKLSAKWYSEFLKGKSTDPNGMIQLKDTSLWNAQFTH
ncbi:hypothetical protein CRYUN_Cryun03dG0126700 [Craigia yunnanensis]